jgi:hypothetical protein
LARAQAESGMRPDVVRHERNGSRSTGIFQLNNRSFPGSETWPIEKQISAALAYLAAHLRACGGDEACAVRGYRTGKLGTRAIREGM